MIVGCEKTIATSIASLSFFYILHRFWPMPLTHDVARCNLIFSMIYIAMSKDK